MHLWVEQQSWVSELRPWRTCQTSLPVPKSLFWCWLLFELLVPQVLTPDWHQQQNPATVGVCSTQAHGTDTCDWSGHGSCHRVTWKWCSAKPSYSIFLNLQTEGQAPYNGCKTHITGCNGATSTPLNTCGSQPVCARVTNTTVLGDVTNAGWRMGQ